MLAFFFPNNTIRSRNLDSSLLLCTESEQEEGRSSASLLGGNLDLTGIELPPGEEKREVKGGRRADSA